jgi:hypothetical protein
MVELRRSEVNREKPGVPRAILCLSSRMSINLREMSLLFEKESIFVGLRHKGKLTSRVGDLMAYGIN